MSEVIGKESSPSFGEIPDGYRPKWSMMPFIALGVAMIIVDATIVNVALPTMISTLHLNSSDAEWLNSIYSLVFASLLITLGRLGDRFGRRKLFAIGVVIFVAASLFTALSSAGSTIIFGRFLQGIGGAMVLPNTLSLVNANFYGKDRQIAFAIWGSTIGGVAALGPLLGGWVTQTFSWRYAFLVNVPVGVAILIGTIFVVLESKDEKIEKGSDLIGNFSIIVSLTFLVFALIEAQRYGWYKPIAKLRLFGFTWASTSISPIPFAILIAIVALAIFTGYELRRGKSGKVTLIETKLFRISSFTFGNIAALIISLGEFGILFALPLFLQGARGYGALGTGVILLGLAIGAFLAGGAVAPLSKRVSAVTVVRIGLFLEIVGVASLALTISPTGPVALLDIPLFVYGFGIGFATAQLTGVVLSDVPISKSGIGSGISSTSRQLGSALGIAILGSVLLSQLSSVLSSSLTKIPSIPAPIASQAVSVVRESAGAAISSLYKFPNGGAIHSAAVNAMVDATRSASLTAATFIAVGFIATLSLKKKVGATESTRDVSNEI
ncbi:MAG: MFS transporter [Actinomycetota bacterium]|nr:MFS transporter [Actinomycetota bacterium]